MVGLSAPLARTEAERSLEELTGLAEAAEVRVELRVLQERARPGSGDVPGPREGGRSGGELRRGGSRSGRGRPRAVAGPAQEPRARAGLQGRGPHPAHPGHLRAAGADARGQAAGRAGAAAIPAPPTPGRRGRAVAARRWHRDSRPGRDQARDGPSPDPPSHRRARAGDRRRAPSSRPASRPPAEGLDSHRGARRLHERRQDDAVQPAGDPAGRGLGCAVRDARPARAAREPARPARAASLGYGRIHRSVAALAGGGLSSHARGSDVGRSPAARDRRRG